MLYRFFRVSSDIARSAPQISSSSMRAEGTGIPGDGFPNRPPLARALLVPPFVFGELIMQSLLRVVVLTGMLSPCWVSGGSSCAADPPLSVGQIAPAFTCLDSDGKTWNSQDLIGKQRLVVYFYPSGFDFCSTRQTLHYQQQLRALAKADVTVVGVSGDQVATQQLFASPRHDSHQVLAKAIELPNR